MSDHLGAVITNPTDIVTGNDAYGVRFTELGEGDIGYLAVGHVRPLAFIAAAVHYTRTVYGRADIRNLLDPERLGDVATEQVQHIRGVFRRPARENEDYGWFVDYSQSAQDDPRALDVTVLTW